MSAIEGTLSSYNQTVGVRVDMDPLVSILPTDDVPLQQWIPNGSPAEDRTVNWLNEALTGQTATAAGNAAGTSAIASTTLKVDDTSIFRVGDVLVRDGQSAADGGVQVLITAVVDSTELTISRPFGGTTDTAIDDDDTVTLIGQYRAEGSDPVDGRAVDRTTDYNYTQIDQEQVAATRTTRKVKRYGMDDPYNHEVQKKFRELAIRHERRVVLGRRLQGTAGDAAKRSMGGLLYFIAGSANSQSGVVANVETLTNSLLRGIWQRGGRVDTLWVSADVKAVFDTLNTSRVRTTNDDRTYGDVVDTFASSFGSIKLRFSRYIPAKKALAVDREFASHRTMDGFFHELLAKTGDTQSGQIVCEKSLEVKNASDAHGVLTLTDA